MEARVVFLFQENDVPALFAQQSADRRPGRTSADYEDIRLIACYLNGLLSSC